MNKLLKINHTMKFDLCRLTPIETIFIGLKRTIVYLMQLKFRGIRVYSHVIF